MCKTPTAGDNNAQMIDRNFLSWLATVSTKHLHVNMEKIFPKSETRNNHNEKITKIPSRPKNVEGVILPVIKIVEVEKLKLIESQY